MATKEEILEELKEAVVEYDEDGCKEAAQKVLDNPDVLTPMEGVLDGLAAGMEKVGELFDSHEYFVPEVLMCADALYAGLDILRPHVKIDHDKGPRASVVLGSVQGDVHDIGKNLVKMMFDIAGWEVHDLGRDVPLEQFVEKQLDTNSDVVAMSAMMTTTMLGMKKVIAMVKEKNPDCLIMLGGAPLTRDVANLFGADGYAESAGNAVSEGIKMISSLRKFQKGDIPE
ncbi:MAG: corrinoid protein [Deltaproteobacteria bacterium]|jgi:corrinoid protein of di/trimethylamine methyltransferase|nr:corrinoid protein [Deltaproteobacteria bacterium]